MSCGVGHRCGLYLPLLWLWCGPTAVAPIGPLALEPPHAMALKKQKKKKKKKKDEIIFLSKLRGLGLKSASQCQTFRPTHIYNSVFT